MPSQEKPKDYFITKDDQTFAGRHVIFDFHGAKNLDNIELMDQAFREVTDKCGATLLHINIHQFQPNGVTGVAILAESHISVHTWPDKGFAAFDVFMCGESQPRLAINIMANYFKPTQIVPSEIKRGLQP